MVQSFAFFALWMGFLAMEGTIRMTDLPPGTNQDESKVPAYTLPPLLRRDDGTTVASAQDWPARRRELLEHFSREMFGRFPTGDPPTRDLTVLEEATPCWDGLGLRRQWRLTWTSKNRQQPATQSWDLLLYEPAGASGPVPVFLGLNFGGNHAVALDPAIRLCQGWMRETGQPGVENHRATEAGRGSEASRWPIKSILQRGYAVATCYYGDIDPDFDDGFANGVHGLWEKPQPMLRLDDAWGSIAGWAWGLTRLADVLMEQPTLDGHRVIVMGHSRLGKTALWAAATDPRLAGVISNNSGCGGAALSRRWFGETVAVINERFPHWFARRFHRFGGREAELPFDQHGLIALVAPRPAYIASAADDHWADPRGEFLSAFHASSVYTLLGVEGLAAKSWPAVNQPVLSRLGYHLRSGPHDVTEFDWEAFLSWADRHVSAAAVRSVAR